MSGSRRPSGSRFLALLQDISDSDDEDESDSDESEEDESDSDSSAEEMKLSKDFYPMSIPTSGALGESSQSMPSPNVEDIQRGLASIPVPYAESLQGTVSSQSSGQHMNLSRDFYQTDIPQYTWSDPERQLSSQSPSSEYAATLPSTSKPTLPKPTLRSTSSHEKYVKSRFVKPIPKPEDESGLDFHWDHYENVAKDYEDVVGAEALENISGSESSASQVSTSSNIKEDCQVLSGIGFNIDYPDGFLGEGFFGAVYKGYYGQTEQNISDVHPSRLFAVKVLEFDPSDDSEALESRQRFETEKYILTNTFHPNVVAIRMVINMGEQKAYIFRDTQNVRYWSPERAYLIMDFAHEGELDKYLYRNQKTIEPKTRIDLIRDLFLGMLFLHQNEIVHGDVHSGNVLIFRNEDGDAVAKWSDFGLGIVGKDKQYQYRTSVPINLGKQFRIDISGMVSVFYKILGGRHLCRPETTEEKDILNQFMEMIKTMRDISVRSLLPISKMYKHILEEELILYEHHFD